MQNLFKIRTSLHGVNTVSGNECLSGRKVGYVLNRSEKGERPNIHRHEIKE